MVSILYHALQGAENCETYGCDVSGDQDIESFFEEAQEQQRQLAGRAKKLLSERLG